MSFSCIDIDFGSFQIVKMHVDSSALLNTVYVEGLNWCASAGVKGEVQEDDAHRLSQRQRQIEFGKNTLGYERYCELIPRYRHLSKYDDMMWLIIQWGWICSPRSWLLVSSISSMHIFKISLSRRLLTGTLLDCTESNAKRKILKRRIPSKYAVNGAGMGRFGNGEGFCIFMTLPVKMEKK